MSSRREVSGPAMSYEPDWGALYTAHRDAMYRVVRSVLRGSGLLDQTDGAVHEAVVSLMAAPPQEVRNWEAVMVRAAKNRAIDLVRSAPVRKAGPPIEDKYFRRETYSDLAEDVSEDLDRQRRAQRVRALLKVLPDREREVIWRRVGLEEPRKQVAADLGVTPGRVSQITEAALEHLRAELGKEER